jgi:transcriptional regulator with XRE-family HTH domain
MRADRVKPVSPREPYGHQRSQENLGKAIRAIRGKAGLSQKQLAERCKLDVSWIARVEAGRVDIDWGNLRRIATGLGVTLEELTSLTRDYEMTEAIGLAVSALRREQGLRPTTVAELAGLTAQELDMIEGGKGPFISTAMEGKLRRGLRVRRKRWFQALEDAKSALGFI